MEQEKTDKITGTYLSADHHTSITCFAYIPKSVAEGEKPAAIVQVIHGMCEYIGRYEHFAAFLAKHRIIMCGADHIGHGSSAASAFELGYFGEKGGDRILVKDAYRLTKKMQGEYPGVPYFYFGHSMGSFVLRQLLAVYKPPVSGAVICGTSGGVPGIAAGKKIIQIRRKLKGAHYRSRFLNRLMFGAYCSRIENPESPHAWISRDPKVVLKYDADPKCNFIFTAAAMEDLVTLLGRVSAPEWAESVDKNLPIYLISGEQDPVGSYGKGVSKVYDRLIAAGVRDVSIQLYPEDRHELLNEPDKACVMADIMTWIQAHKDKAINGNDVLPKNLTS